MGTGYIRQSSSTIVNSATIQASHFNLEYELLEDAFDGSTGHDHDGSTGNGPQIPLTTSVTGTLPIANGGTNAATAAAARTALGLVIGTDVQTEDAGLTSIAGLTTAADKMIYTTASDTYAVTDLSSFARTVLDDVSAAAARTTLGLAIGTDVQAYDVGLADVAGLTPTDGNIIVGDGANWVAESGATARTSLGLDSMATQADTSVDINGGAIDGTAIGDNSASTGDFTTLHATSLTSDSITTWINGTFIKGGTQDQDYEMLLNIPEGFTINKVRTQASTGTCTATVKIEGVALGGTANSVTTSTQTQTHSSANTVSTGNDLVVTISGSSSCEDVSVWLEITGAL